jgi:hypothetical protein
MKKDGALVVIIIEHEAEINKMCTELSAKHKVYSKTELYQQAYLIILENKNITMKDLYWKLDYYCDKQKIYEKRFKNGNIDDRVKNI